MSFETILKSHSERYPAWQVQDVYKLAHQASMGAEHTEANLSSARTWLERELAEMGDGSNEPVVDPISADGEIVRIHLRPYLASGGDTESLLAAFIDTVNELRGKISDLEAYWDIAMQNCSFPVSEMLEFFRSKKEVGYPAVHHSEKYKELYCPAYRVVRRKYLLDQEIGE